MSLTQNRHAASSETVAENRLQLAIPPNWIDSKRAWHGIVQKARHYARHRLPVFDELNTNDEWGSLFDDLAQIAAAIREGTSFEELRRWLKDPTLRECQDARLLRNLMSIMDKLEIF